MSYILNQQLIVMAILFSIVKCENIEEDPCKDRFYWVSRDFTIFEKASSIEDVTEECSKRTCITKCCKVGQVHYTRNDFSPNCLEIDDVKSFVNNQVEVSQFNYTELKFYKLNFQNKLVESQLTKDDFKIRFNGKFYIDIDNCTNGLYAPGVMKEEFFIFENGTLGREKPNHYDRFQYISPNNFCFEYLVEHYVIENKSKVDIRIHFLRHPKSEAMEEDGDGYSFFCFRVAAFIISSFFLLLVLIVYGSLPELRGIGVMMQMAYCATYMLALILNTVEFLTVQSLIYVNGGLGCRYIMFLIYYLLFASFFWMNIMSFDLWWAFRGSYNQRQIHRKGEKVKFCWYALYAWGTPLLITIAVTVIDNSDLSNYPYIMKPFFENCFQSDSKELKFYYNVPIGIMIAANFFFFVLTAYTYWRIKSNLDKFTDCSLKNNKSKSRFAMYFKLAVIMGVGWVFDVAILPHWLEIIASIYNSLLGVTIFFVFVFKKKIFVKLCQRYGLQDRYKFINNLQRKWSTTTTHTQAIKKRSISETVTQTHRHSTQTDQTTVSD